MSSTYSTTLRLELIGNGEQSGVWGSTTNTNWNLMEQAVAGVQTITMANANYTLSNLNGVLDEARNAVLVVGGSNSALRDLIPPLVEKLYTVVNNTGYAIRVIGATGTGVTIPNGSTTLVYCNGTNVVTGYDYYTTPITGIVKGNGSTFVQAVANTDYLYPNLGVLTGAFETNTISASAATGTINYDLLTQSVTYLTANATGNWTVNFRASSGTTLNSVMAANQSVTCALISAMGSSAYYNTNVTIDGVAVTPKWQGGTAPVAGVANALNVYTYTIIKTGSATYTVLASQTKFA